MITYYVVLMDGIPIAVSLSAQRAAQTAKEMETANKKTQVIPTWALENQTVEDVFTDEEPTDPNLNGFTSEF